MKRLIAFILIVALCLCMVSCGKGKNESQAKPKIDAAAIYDDVNKGDWFEESISWGVSEGVMDAAKPNLFGVNTAMTKAELILSMWKAAGAPGKVVSAKTIADSDPNSDLSKAISWGLENKVIAIKSEASTKEIASRLDAIDFIWKEADSPQVSTINNFDDTTGVVSTAWAKQNGVALGIGDNLFAPNMDCSKAHMITFLFRAK